MIEECGKSIYVLYKSEQKKDDYQWSSQVHIHIFRRSIMGNGTRGIE